MKEDLNRFGGNSPFPGDPKDIIGKVPAPIIDPRFSEDVICAECKCPNFLMTNIVRIKKMPGILGPDQQLQVAPTGVSFKCAECDKPFLPGKKEEPEGEEESITDSSAEDSEKES